MDPETRKIPRQACCGAAADDRGGVSVLSVLGLSVVFGFAALTVDLGAAYVTQTNLQNAADAAALAAVRELGNVSQVTTVATDFVARNITPSGQGEGGGGDSPDDFTASPSVAVVQGKWDPVTRIFTATDIGPNAVRVITSRTEAGGNSLPTFFARILGFASLDVSAVAVATAGSSGCVYAIESTHKEAMFLSSGSRLDAIDCSVQVLSDGETPAIRTNSGSSIQVSDDQRICAESYAGSGYSQTPVAGCPAPGELDPLAGKTHPTVDPCTGSKTDLSISSNTTLSPGTYCKKLEIHNGTTVTLQSGIYVIRGALLKINSGAKLRVEPGGSGVFLYFVRDGSFGDATLDINAGSDADLWAQSSGPYQGILLYSHSGNAINVDHIVNSQSSGFLKGTAYFPRSRVVLDDFSKVNASCGAWIAKEYYFNSGSRFDITPGTQVTCGFPPTAGGAGIALVQ
jgi:Flp pilus assembly protein TadG